MRKIVRILVVSAMSIACSSSSSPPTDQHKGVEGEGFAAQAAPDTNPDGVPYPKDNIGTVQRKGETPGSRIANFKFMGYPDADVAGGLKPISLAQYFDASGARYKILHIQAVAVWCDYCRGETDLVAQMKADLGAKGVVWLVSLAEGPTPGTASTQKHLDGWINQFKSPYTHVLDPNNANLGPFYDRSAFPWNANIDARTMEILTAGTGAASSPEDILKEIDGALALAAKSKLVTAN